MTSRTVTEAVLPPLGAVREARGLNVRVVPAGGANDRERLVGHGLPVLARRPRATARAARVRHSVELHHDALAAAGVGDPMHDRRPWTS
jgi:hypothetical protein